MKHTDSDMRCLAGGHKPPCIWCPICESWVHPAVMNNECRTPRLSVIVEQDAQAGAEKVTQ